MIGRLFLTFSLVTLLELAILIPLGQWMGLGPTILLVLVTGIIGAWLAKREGLRALARFQSEAAEGKVPTDPIMDGLAVFAAALFLMTPGVLTDFVGFFLLIPIARAPLKKALRKRVKTYVTSGNGGGGFTAFYTSGSNQSPRGWNPRVGSTPGARAQQPTSSETTSSTTSSEFVAREPTIRDAEFIDDEDR